MVSPQWIEWVCWEKSEVFVKITREVIKTTPEYESESLLNRDYEISLHKHYDRKGYWVGESA